MTEYENCPCGGRRPVALTWRPVAQKPEQDALVIGRDADGQMAFVAYSQQYGFEHVADVDCGEIVEWYPLPRNPYRQEAEAK